MITSYSKFIIESNNLKPEDFGIKEYEWNNDFLDCNQDVSLAIHINAKGRRTRGIPITEFPFNFGKIKGYFHCYNNELTTLKGCPKEVYGEFDCADNKLTSLEFCPRIVKGDFNCSDNEILGDIENYPMSIIDGDIYGSFEEDLVDYLCDLIKENEELFIPLLDDKIKFHQMIIRLDKSLIKYYENIPEPSKNSRLLL